MVRQLAPFIVMSAVASVSLLTLVASAVAAVGG